MTTVTGTYEILYGLTSAKHYAMLYKDGCFVRGKSQDLRDDLSILTDVLQPLVDLIPQEGTVQVNPRSEVSAESLRKQVKVESVSLLDRIIKFDMTPKNNV